MQVYQKINTQMFRGSPPLRRALIVCSLEQRSLLTYSCLRFFNLAKSSFCRFWILFEDKSLSNKKENTWYVGLIKTNVFITLNCVNNKMLEYDWFLTAHIYSLILLCNSKTVRFDLSDYQKLVIGQVKSDS